MNRPNPLPAPEPDAASTDVLTVNSRPSIVRQRITACCRKSSLPTLSRLPILSATNAKCSLRNCDPYKLYCEPYQTAGNAMESAAAPMKCLDDINALFPVTIR